MQLPVLTPKSLVGAASLRGSFPSLRFAAMFSLQRLVFNEENERLVAVVPIRTAGKKEKKAKLSYLCMSGALPGHISAAMLFSLMAAYLSQQRHGSAPSCASSALYPPLTSHVCSVKDSGAYLHKVKVTNEESYSKRRTWNLGELSEVENCVDVDGNATTEFALRLDKVHHWIAPSVAEKQTFLASLGKVSQPYLRVRVFHLYSPTLLLLHQNWLTGSSLCSGTVAARPSPSSTLKALRAKVAPSAVDAVENDQALQGWPLRGQDHAARVQAPSAAHTPQVHQRPQRSFFFYYYFFFVSSHLHIFTCLSFPTVFVLSLHRLVFLMLLCQTKRKVQMCSSTALRLQRPRRCSRRTRGSRTTSAYLHTAFSLSSRLSKRSVLVLGHP